MCRQYLPPHRAPISRAREPAVKAWKMDPFARFYPAAGLFNDNCCKTRRGNNENTHTTSPRRASDLFCFADVRPKHGRSKDGIHALAAKFNEVFNKHDPAAVAAFYTEDAVWQTYHGTFYGRQRIEKVYAEGRCRVDAKWIAADSHSVIEASQM